MNRKLLVIVATVGLVWACKDNTRKAAPADAAADLTVTDQLSDLGTDVGKDVADTQGELDAYVPTEPATLIRECHLCHDLAALGKADGFEETGPRAWMEQQGQGLVRYTPAIADAATHLAFPWARRGFHAEFMLEGTDSCGICHPVDDNGIGHGLRIYGTDTAVPPFTGGSSCAGACHSWIPDDATVTGFTPVDSETPTYTGSLRPGDLLNGAETAHTALWKAGSQPEMAMKIASFQPGCAGCHNVADEAHGAIQSCLKCHKMAGSGQPLHDKMVAAISTGKDQIDPEGNVSACAYCHFEDGAEHRSNAACYNCHLSGHQPMDSEGKPHFWQ